MQSEGRGGGAGGDEERCIMTLQRARMSVGAGVVGRIRRQGGAWLFGQDPAAVMELGMWSKSGRRGHEVS